MLLNEYQNKAVTTAIYPEQQSFKGLTYCALKLAGEAGEVAEKIGKIIRDDNGVVTYQKREELSKELGDVLWYIANMAQELDYSLDRIAQINLDKLADRKKRGALHGSGDNR